MAQPAAPLVDGNISRKNVASTMPSILITEAQTIIGLEPWASHLAVTDYGEICRLRAFSILTIRWHGRAARIGKRIGRAEW